MSFEPPMVRLDSVAQINPRRKVSKGNSVPFIDMAALPQNSRDISYSDVVLREVKGAGAHFQNGDTLLARITPCLENGKTAQVRQLKTGEVGEGSTEFITLCGIEPTDNDYVYYLCRDPVFREYAIGRMEGTSGRQRVSWQSIAAYEFICPGPLERRAAARALGALDDRITLLRETNATLEAIAQALFKSWFVDFDPVRANMARRSREGGNPEAGGACDALDPRLRGNDGTGMDEATAALFPDGFEESALGLVPRGWRVGTLANLAEFQNGYAFKSKDWVNFGHPVVKIGDVKPGIIDFAGCSFVTPATTSGLDRFRLQRGNLLVGMTGYVGETGLVAEVEPAAYLNQRVGRIATARGMHDGGFVYCLVRNTDFKAYAEAQSQGSAQANVSGSALLNYDSILPPADAYSKFNDLMHPILETILSNHEQAQTLATLRDTLLPRLISGQLRLPEPCRSG